MYYIAISLIARFSSQKALNTCIFFYERKSLKVFKPLCFNINFPVLLPGFAEFFIFVISALNWYMQFFNFIGKAFLTSQQVLNIFKI